MSRILDAAEELFIDNGFNGTSLRMITDLAGVNLAAVNYHFGSKDMLAEEVFKRRFTPYLEAVKKCLLHLQPQQKCTVEDLVTALLTPLNNLIEQDTPERPISFIRLCTRMLIDHHEVISKAIQTASSGEVINYFYSLYQPLVPSVSREEISWRLYFAIKVIFSGYNGLDVFGVHRGHPERLNSFNNISQYLIPFLTVALAAPPTEQTGGITFFS